MLNMVFSIPNLRAWCMVEVHLRGKRHLPPGGVVEADRNQWQCGIAIILYYIIFYRAVAPFKYRQTPPPLPHAHTDNPTSPIHPSLPARGCVWTWTHNLTPPPPSKVVSYRTGGWVRLIAHIGLYAPSCICYCYICSWIFLVMKSLSYYIMIKQHRTIQDH